eukprot:1131947-Pelagomonas_calceolata.AAC.1
MYANDEYILVDGCKQACVRPIMELSKAAHFPPCCFPCTPMMWITWQKMYKGLLQALGTFDPLTCCMQTICASPVTFLISSH